MKPIRLLLVFLLLSLPVWAQTVSIEIIDGHRYQVTRDAEGKITKKEGKDLPVPAVPSPEEMEVAALLAVPKNAMTAAQRSRLLQLIAKRVYGL